MRSPSLSEKNNAGLTLAVLDPFSLNLLDFAVINQLAKLKRIDTSAAA